MDSKQLIDLIDQVDDNLESLEDALQPILEDSLNSASKKLPILDRAKLNITAVYAVESLLFSYLRLNGVNAKEHPVFQELDRVKRYFGKVKEVEEKSIVSKPNITLNKQAAARIIQSSLANSGSSDPAQRERELKERLIAMRKLKAAQATPGHSPTPVANPNITPSVPVTAPPVTNDTVLEDQSSAEEGEIEEDSNVQITETVLQPANHDLSQQSSKKRKQGQNNNITQHGGKANKKARKKKKKHAKNGT